MKKTALVVLAFTVFSFTSVQTADASWWDDVTTFFSEVFAPEKKSPEPKETLDIDIKKISAEKEPENKTESRLKDASIESIIEKIRKQNEDRMKEFIEKNKDVIEKKAEAAESTKSAQAAEKVTTPVTQPTPAPTPVATEAPVNFGCSTIVTEFGPTQTRYMTDMPYGSQNRHTEILRYKIKWFDGTWSGWFNPGKNDRDWKDANKHVWRYFDDHRYQVEHCANYQYRPGSGASNASAVAY